MDERQEIPLHEMMLIRRMKSPARGLILSENRLISSKTWTHLQTIHLGGSVETTYPHAVEIFSTYLIPISYTSVALLTGRPAHFPAR
jgi:hypothetical protein